MRTERLVVDFERQADQTVVLRVSGRLEQATVPLLEGVLQALRDTGSPVTVDLAGVEHIDGRGVDLLLTTEATIVGVPESLRPRPPLD